MKSSTRSFLLFVLFVVSIANIAAMFRYGAFSGLTTILGLSGLPIVNLPDADGDRRMIPYAEVWCLVGATIAFLIAASGGLLTPRNSIKKCKKSTK
jgi:hypothetical protein